METLQAYLNRKRDELLLLNDYLRRPLSLEPVTSVETVIQQKFRLAAALKAQYALDHWTFTETAWTGDSGFQSGPFRFRYGYQRADLSVSGPAIYKALGSLPRHFFRRTIYTASGMAAISSLLAALGKLPTPVQMIAHRGSYSETIEFIEKYGSKVQLRCVSNIRQYDATPHGKVLWLDSCIGTTPFKGIVHCPLHPGDLILFDTTGLWTNSGRVQRVLDWAIKAGAAIILLRSHTKLDSLGIEYGRLGSLTFVGPPAWRFSGQESLECIADLCADAIRLFGSAALPAHFPPFVGSPAYVALSAQRIAAMLRNSRHMMKKLRIALPNSTRDFTHQLYIALEPTDALTEWRARDLAESMCRDLSASGLPLCHAGSFGFDFAAAEGFHDTARDSNIVRIAVPDLPTELWDRTAVAIIGWWNKNAAPMCRQARQSHKRPRPAASSRIWQMTAKAIM